MEEEQTGKKEKIVSELNFYVIAFITAGILIYIIGSAIEPDVETELDFYEATSSAGFGSAAVFSWIAAKRYWGSSVFGKAYLSFALAYTCYFIGWNLFWVYEIIYQIENPYPYYPDIFFFAYYPLIIYHIRKNFIYFNRTLQTNQKLIIIIIPIIVTSFYAIFGIIPIEQHGGLGTITINPIPEYDEDFYKSYFTGLVFTAATSLTFSSALVATQIFRKTVLGSAWGLLLVGILLGTAADLYYYLNELFEAYERGNPVTGIWLVSAVFVCYAMYKHRKEI